MSSENLSPRDRILKTAGNLFYKEGYRAIGIDRVIAEAEVAKATFYKHFPSKDDLIVAWIKQAEGMTATILPSMDSATPLFDYMDKMIGIARENWCMGCTFQGTASEFVDVTHPAHAASKQVKENVLTELTRRAKAQGLTNPRRVAEQMYLLLEGVWATVRMFQSDAPLAHARDAVRKLAA
jgi:AcrR family transcriptional regulator